MKEVNGLRFKGQAYYQEQYGEASDFSLKNYQNRTAICCSLSGYLLVIYLENDELANDYLIEFQESSQEEEDDEEQYLNYTFCGKVKNLYYIRSLGQIIQVNVRNYEEKKFQFQKRYLNYIYSTKGSDTLYLNWKDDQCSFEIRNSETLELLEQYYPVQQSLRHLKQDLFQVKNNYCQHIYNGRFKWLFTIFGKHKICVNQKICVQLMSKKTPYLRVFYFLSKIKLLRKFIFEQTPKVRLINDQVLIQGGEKVYYFFIYQWWKGKLIINDDIYELVKDLRFLKEGKAHIYLMKFIQTESWDYQNSSPSRQLDRYALY